MSEKSRSVAKSISVLGIAGIVCKLIGVLFSIPLNMISPQVATVFYLVYPTYTLLLTISSAGLPVAVSRMVAGFLAKSDRNNAWNTFRVALTMLLSVGGLFSVLMLLTNGLLVSMVGVEESSAGFYAIAPCVMIVCILSAFRGLMQGQQNMVPTAVSQVVEQVGRVVISLPLAALGMRRSMAEGAAGALIGITFVEALALLYMVVRYWLRRSEFTAYEQLSADPPVSRKKLI